MKKLCKIILSSVVLAFTMACSTQVPEVGLVTENGTIQYFDLEGGFYGVINEHGKTLDPINLPLNYQVDGLQVSLSYRLREDMMSLRMVGTIIEIVEISEL